MTATRTALAVIFACLLMTMTALGATALGAEVLPANAPSNGAIPARLLSPAAQGGCVKLVRPAARAYNIMQLSAGRVLPANGCDSAYRTLARQVFYRNFWCARGKCGNAAVPGTSNHGLGLAVDVPRSIREAIDRIGARYGWCKVPRSIGSVACLSDAPQEWWHIRWTRGVFAGKANPCVVSEGVSDPCVRGLKRRLNAHEQTHLKVTKEYGSATRRRVLAFQRSHRLTADGIVGPATWKQLYRKPAPAKCPTPVGTAPIRKTPAGTVPGAMVRTPSKCEPSRPARGVDVSVHQGSIDWQAVRGAGYTFAIAKATEGQDFTDSTFSAARVTEIRRTLGRVGAYHFLRPRAGRSGAVEAQHYVRVARSRGIDWRKGHDLRPVADIEVTALSGQGTCTYLRQFITEVKRLTGRRTLVYTFPGFANTQLRCPWIDSTHALWIAHFGVPRPLVPTAWTPSGYSVWQFTSDGRVSGIPSRVDLNITTTRALRALAAR